MSEVTWGEAPSLQNPLLVVAFEGWFDAGECATGAIQWIVDQYDARRVAQIDPKSFLTFKKIVHMSKLLKMENDESDGRLLMRA
jgi:hypothetical protein